MTAPASERAVALLRRTYGRGPQRVVRSPGRVNLIGEHTDYNDGFVLPMAIEPALWLAVAADEDARLRLVSDDLGGAIDLGLGADGGADRLPGWGAYGQGVAWALQRAGVGVRGLTGALASDIPTGAGLSSSAALELAVARALVADGDWDATRMARLAQQSENEWVGVQTGIMDQLAVAGGRADHALLIDCRDTTVTPVPLPDDVAVLVMDTSTRRELVGSAYDDRRAQCEEAAHRLGVPALRDATPDMVAGLDDPLLRRRARHVTTENARTRAAAEALRAGDAVRVGALMDASHESLRDDFAVSSDELDTIVALARRQQACHGARMTGGGFGGCAVALVDRAGVGRTADAVAAAYRDATGLDARMIVTSAAAGTGFVAPGEAPPGGA